MNVRGAAAGVAARALLLSLALCASTALFAQSDEAVRYEAESLLMFNQHLYYGNMVRPRGLAIDKSHSEIWVADAATGRIAIFRPDGAELFSFVSKLYLRDPARIAIAPDGGVAVVEGDRAHVRRFNYRGDYKGDVALPGLPEKPIVGAVAYDSDGNLYLGENRSSQIFVYGRDGRLKFQFGSRGTDEGQFQSIVAITVAGDGSIYVADQQALAVQVFDSQGNFDRGWGKHEMGANNFSLPSGLAVDATGRVFVTDELRHQVKVFTPEGKLLTQFGGLGAATGQLSFPTDIAIDADGHIFVAERGNSRIQVFRLIELPSSNEP